MRDGNVAISLVYRAERYIPPHLERNVLVSYILHPLLRGRFCQVEDSFLFYSSLEGLNHRPLDNGFLAEGITTRGYYPDRSRAPKPL